MRPRVAPQTGRRARQRHGINAVASTDTSHHPWVRDLPPVTSGNVGSYLGVPVFAPDGLAAGAICVFSPEPHEWDDSDIRSMVDLANLVNRELAHHAGDGLRSSMIERLGNTLQNLVLPTALPDVAGIEMCARYAPASDGLLIGGDWYDCFQIADDRISLAVGDVAGHGIQAAATMAQLRSALRAYALIGGSPSAVVAQLEYLVSEIEPETLVALALGELDPGTGVVQLTVAGLTPPLVIAKGVAQFLHGAEAPPLNARASPSDEWTEQHVRLEPGDMLVLFSDGLVERRGIGLDTCLERLRLYAQTIGPETATKDVCNDIVHEMTGASLTEDDVCVLVVRYLGPDHK